MIALAGVAIIVLGWGYNIAFFKSGYPGWVTCKPLTALAIICMAGILFAQTMPRTMGWDIIIVVFSWWLVLIGLNSSLASFVQDDTQTWYTHDDTDFYTIIKGLPAPMTIICFLIMSISGFVIVRNTEKMHKRLRMLSIVLSSISSLAILGYILQAPLLYYYVANLSNAMSFNAAFLFTACGITLFFITSNSSMLYKQQDQINLQVST